MSKEHVFGRWVAKLGLDSTPARHRAGPLNRIPRDMGEQPPFRLTVRDVCANCNNGWMASLEATAQRVLSPLIRGDEGVIAHEDQASITTWIRKTALVAMLLSSDDQRVGGYGLPPTEYMTLHLLQGQPEYLHGCQAWVGASGEPDLAAVQVTPMCVCISDDPEPDRPNGYLVTISLGALVLQALWFITPALAIEMNADPRLARIWPSGPPAVAPFREPSGEKSFKHLAVGGELRSTVQNVSLQPWSRASNLPQSEIRNGMVQVPALCGNHAVRYPAALLQAALRGPVLRVHDVM